MALISPFRFFRQYARSLTGRFVEVWVNCSIETCCLRDPKGLYRRVAEGKMSNLTGIQDPYEPPINPEIIVDTEHESPDACMNKIIMSLKSLKYIE